MSVTNILWRNVKWRFHNVFTIVITILQPMLWLVLYSAVAGQSMKGMAISNYTAFILPGLMILVSLGACSSSGIMNFLMKTDGSFYRILIAPIPRASIILGQMLEAVLCTIFEVIIMCIVSLFFSVKIATGITGIILISIIISMTAFFISGITYTISLCLPNAVIYETIMNAIVLPIFFLSTALFPADNLTGGLAIAVHLNPFTHIINVLRGLILGDAISIQNMVSVFLLLLIMSWVSFMLALRRLKKEMMN